MGMYEVDRERHKFGRRVSAKFAAQAASVRSNRGGAEVQHGGDLLCRSSLRQQLDYREFPVCYRRINHRSPTQYSINREVEELTEMVPGVRHGYL